ncbi:MarR family winged helix-turn-helix transcriptional regulator [Ornithinibacillus scapharcae]|uniref:MarR family winged helix-turn-helix transcriptional regulator n=1 Tax=Ornithinibacillus scapharcae TaxID=1147159 RepID=UPI000225AFF1|nr:MarR family winged helix-turn-helix transcriptional regulator [Ornithinibacillus scapharcae]
MSSQFQYLDLIDTLSERHIQLRETIENKWNKQSNIYLSNTEWFILAKIYQKETTIAYVTKQVGISRQATHKFIKNLEVKGLVEVFNVPHNKKDKYLKMTQLGEECYEKNIELKAKLEKKIAKSIGQENFTMLRELLKSDWGL